MTAVFRSSWERRLGRTESPIEAALLDNFCVLAQSHGYAIGARSSRREGFIVVCPQKQMDRYRLDFLIEYHFFGKDLAIAVECDGHDFHEKTKQQATRDKRRDRALQRLGLKVFRFTGSELRGNPSGSAFEVLDAIMEFQTACFTSALKNCERNAA